MLGCTPLRVGNCRIRGVVSIRNFAPLKIQTVLLGHPLLYRFSPRIASSASTFSAPHAASIEPLPAPPPPVTPFVCLLLAYAVDIANDFLSHVSALELVFQSYAPQAFTGEYSFRSLDG